MQFGPAKVVVHGARDVLTLSEVPMGADTPMLIIDNFFYSFNNTVPSYMPMGEAGLLRSMSYFVWSPGMPVVCP